MLVWLAELMRQKLYQSRLLLSGESNPPYYNIRTSRQVEKLQTNATPFEMYVQRDKALRVCHVKVH